MAMVGQESAHAEVNHLMRQAATSYNLEQLCFSGSIFHAFLV